MQSHLVALDPVSLRVVRRGAAVLTGRNRFYEFLPPEVALVSPDGSQVAIVADAALNFYDLSDLRLLGTARLGSHPDTGPKRPGQVKGEADVIRAGAWLGDNVVALVQHMGPPYARKVTSRAIVVVDGSRRHISRRAVALKGTVVGSVRPGAGVTSIDPETGRATIITRQGNWVLPTPDRLIVGGPNLGLTAFARDGKQVWHAARHQTVYPYAIGDTVFAPHQVKRHTIVDAYAIDTGRHRASVFQRGQGTRPFSGALLPTG
jgi:hypothetical protein